MAILLMPSKPIEVKLILNHELVKQIALFMVKFDIKDIDMFLSIAVVHLLNCRLADEDL